MPPFPPARGTPPFAPNGVPPFAPTGGAVPPFPPNSTSPPNGLQGSAPPPLDGPAPGIHPDRLRMMSGGQ